MFLKMFLGSCKLVGCSHTLFAVLEKALAPAALQNPGCKLVLFDMQNESGTVPKLMGYFPVCLAIWAVAANACAIAHVYTPQHILCVPVTAIITTGFRFPLWHRETPLFHANHHDET